MGKQRRFKLPPSRKVCTTPNKGQDCAESHPPINHQGFTQGLNYMSLSAPCTQSLSSRPFLTCLQKAHHTFSCLSTVSKRKEHGCRWKTRSGRSRRVSGHLRSLPGLLKQHGLPRVVPWSWSSSRGRWLLPVPTPMLPVGPCPGALILRLPLQLNESYPWETETQALSWTVTW